MSKIKSNMELDVDAIKQDILRDYSDKRHELTETMFKFQILDEEDIIVGYIASLLGELYGLKNARPKWYDKTKIELIKFFEETENENGTPV
jgi:hypothetical protein